MSRFLLAWELGRGYGHLAGLMALADELARRGHEPVLAVRDRAAAAVVMAGRPYALLQAPVFPGPRPPDPHMPT
ncbi:MAG: hypothetical protein IRY94_20985, partial [Rhodospirillaceae bacterium]|nr:hypothetical protein [Rhodospirillaceae bacterium]